MRQKRPRGRERDVTRERDRREKGPEGYGAVTCGWLKKAGTSGTVVEQAKVSTLTLPYTPEEVHPWQLPSDLGAVHGGLVSTSLPLPNHIWSSLT